MTQTPLCNDWSQRLSRQPDGDAFYLICTGGVRCAERDADVWHIEPIFDGESASARGFMTKSQLQAYLRQSDLKPVAFHRLGWFHGDYHSGWSPIIPGRTSHMQGAVDMWGHIEGNLCSDRTGSTLDGITEPDQVKLANLLDDQTDAERLAHCISLSLRNMDIAVEQVTEFYNEHLVNLMAGKNLYGSRSGSYQDVALYAHVHSFFMHLGAARDYFAAFIASRLGKDPLDIDSMAKLISVLRTADIPSDDLLGVLQTRGYLQHKATSLDKIEAVGWLKEVTNLRNQFVHRRPYGSKYVEQSGYAQAIDKSAGLYRYVRPVVQADGAEEDILDLIARHYAVASSLFYECAEKSGHNTAMMTLTDKDIISIDNERS